MSSILKKEDAHRLVEELPDNATWGDLRYQIYVRESIERGLEDSRAGRVIPESEIRKKYGIPE